MRKSQMTDLERAVCRRLKAARERIGITQQKCAEEIEVNRASLATYETVRSPVRLDVGLRFCRRFIVSEEWLATGGYASAIAAAPLHGQNWQGMPAGLEEYFFRHCLDLQQEPEALKVKPSLAFGRAFAACLQPVFARLAVEFFHYPRVVFTDDDDIELIADFVHRIFALRARLLANEAAGVGVSPGGAAREFARVSFESDELLWNRMMGIATPEYLHPRFNFLRALNYGPDVPFGIVAMKKAGAEPQGVVENVASRAINQPMPSELQTLIKRVSAQLNARGAKAELARSLNVPLQRVSHWLRSASAPNAEDTLRLLSWVKDREDNPKKESAPVLAGADKKTQATSKSTSNEKAKPGRKRP